MVEWSCTKERLNERGSYIFVEWSCANKKNKSVSTLSLGWMVVTKERTNEKEPHIWVKWSFAHKINKSMRTLSFGQMVVYKRKIKWKRFKFLSNSCVQIREINQCDTKFWSNGRAYSRTVREVSLHPAFTGNYLTIN